MLGAHADGSAGALIQHYAKAAEMAETEGDVDRAAFFLTHAWVFALEAGDERAATFREKLASWSRV